ncbi:MAG TPA: 2-oxo acid dehydrogenase subunit E2 [Rhodopila sp.]|uniref:2-oxo acid dehydrogenase subunit E2 n=1 Tax=Rhodopila sp. TaxID=2480087 RepID=UPI002BB6AB72|nr:2-oxo acid dehydrogenase subunit E2 [Rhodopila sp.]HVY15348.1 2-oxo acid dehydrogenase subunit E2 [Rhodopila sp.]
MGFPKVETYDYALFGPVEVRPLSNIRKIIGRRLHAAWANVPQVTQFDEVDLTALEALRAELKPKAEAQGIKLTLLAFIMKACAQTLARFPEFNASLDDSGDNLVLKKYCHIGFAADTPMGLLAPVVRDVDKKGLFDIARAIAELAEKARLGRLAFTDAEGGCFSVSNLGQLGGTGFTPTINAPEVAVLGVARAAEKVVVQDGQFVVRLVLPLALVYDHRVVDGAQGGRFMAMLRDRLHNPESLRA